ncbi:WbqC family protein [Neolewinella antarctica]|uniref:WbqC-like protein n=1 Tax=Neolewinella antarctica TaxID=442734 RepID=A0ABX0X6P7_9BACT|nr:WbqC family protein [Neolewinella antarctica]NJC24878.1 hypothetical protein [Neolewinella antarctica]
MPLTTPTAYFPPAHWASAGFTAGAWTVEAHENYQRKGFRNRARIAGPNGPLWLTVPLTKGKNQRTPIGEVTIANEYDWRREHEASIRTAYGRSPFYEHYAEAIFTILRLDHQYLLDLNNTLLTSVLALLNPPIGITESTEFIGADKTKHLPRLAPYPQVFTDRFGYQPGLSILDALFCLGPALPSHPTVAI